MPDLDYAELVEALRYCSKQDNCGSRCPRYDRGEKCRNEIETEAADAIEELLGEVPHWISVEERLPEPFVCVLAHIPGEKPFPTVKSAFLKKNGLWYSNGFRYNPEEVTHWCEMPEPPKGVE
jgi:hypothetical protein